MVLFRILSDELQRCLSILGESRLDQVVAEMQSQLDTDRRSIQAGDAVPFDAVQDPDVVNVLEEWLGFLWSGGWPGVRHGARS